MAGEARALGSAPRTRPGDGPLVVAGIGLVAAAVYVGVALATARAPLVAGAISVQAAAYLIGGAIVLRRRPAHRFGAVLLVAGYLSLVNALLRVESIPALLAIGASYQGFHEAVLGYLILTFPSARPSRSLPSLVAVGLVVGFGMLTTFRLLSADPDLLCIVSGWCATGPNPFRVWDVGWLAFDLTDAATRIAAPVVAVVAVGRYVSAHGAARRVLLPVLAAGTIMALTVLANSLIAAVAGPSEVAFALSRLGQILLPLALVIGFLRSRMARAGVVDLVLAVGPAPSPADVEVGIRRVLHDQSARLFLWSSSLPGYVDVADRPATLPAETGRRQLTLVTDGARPIAAIAHDPILAEESGLLSAVAAAVRIVLQNRSLATSVRAQQQDLARLPRGEVTFLYADVEGSTSLLHRLADRYVDLIGDLRRLLREITARNGGMEVDSRADEFFAAFPDAPSAAVAALEAQDALRVHSWPDRVTVRIRIGLHTGRPRLTDEGYVGVDVHLAARVGSVGHGGQVVLSAAAREALGTRAPDRFAVIDLGAYRLRGIPDAQMLAQLVDPGNDRAFPPLRAEPS